MKSSRMNLLRFGLPVPVPVSVLVLVSLVHFVSSQTNNLHIVYKNVDRSMDLTSQLVKITNVITVENTGTEAVKSVSWAVGEEGTGTLSYLSAKDSSRRELRLSESRQSDRPAVTFYTISLAQPIAHSKTGTITVEEVYSRALVPHPPAITQKERQLVLYDGNHYVYTPYVVKTQLTKVTIKSKSIENYSKTKPVSQSEGLITYGPYENIQPFTVDKMTVHYENNSPFLTVKELHRYIEVSHWGNIAVEENINLLHTGAKLKGSFSRYEFQRDTTSGLNAVKSFKTLLPASAEKPYYRDHNGNVSTSNMRVRKDSVELDLRPRFPLFGGWKTSYTLGYNVPSYQYLFHDGDQFVLKIRAIDHIYDDMHVDFLQTKIVLPVAARNIKLKAPYPINRLADEFSFKYLDTKGRTVVTFTKTNLVENHIQDFELKYNWSYVLMLHEPVLLIAALYLLFMCIIVYVRLDFSLQKSEKEHHK